MSSGPLNGKTWHYVALSVFSFLVAGALYIQFNDAAVISFGDPLKSYLKAFSDNIKGRPPVVPEIAPGDQFQMCFDGIDFYRWAPSVGTLFFIDSDGRKHTIPASDPLGRRDIPPPPGMGPYGPKCRPAVMPDLGMPEGPAILSGTFTSTDDYFWRTRIVRLPYPQMSFILKRKP
jgi:hypothetical protein